jgi:hypothetical protein
MPQWRGAQLTAQGQLYLYLYSALWIDNSIYFFFVNMFRLEVRQRKSFNERWGKQIPHNDKERFVSVDRGGNKVKINTMWK